MIIQNFLLVGMEFKYVEEIVKHSPITKVKKFSALMKYSLNNKSTLETPCWKVSFIETVLKSPYFFTAITELTMKCKRNAASDVVSKFQHTLKTVCVKEVKVKPTFELNGIIIEMKEIAKKFHYNEVEATLCLTNDLSSLFEVEDLSAELLNSLLQKVNVTNTSLAEKMRTVVGRMLSCESLDDVAKVIEKWVTHEESSGPIKMEAVRMQLGSNIPRCWHHTLQQCIVDEFEPEEVVAFEKSGFCFVYAQILYQVENIAENYFKKEYCVHISDEKQATVNVLQLYRFALPKKSCRLHPKALATERKSSLSNSLFADIRAQVKLLYQLPQEQRERGIKRLYLHHHLATYCKTTSIDLFVMQEMDRLEKGLAEDELPSNKECLKAIGDYVSKVQNLFSKLNRIAGFYKIQASEESKDKIHFDIVQPKIDISKAKQWINLAENDYKAVLPLNVELATQSNLSSVICTKAYEVAEKSLKAGMYAMCGLGEVSLKSHDLTILANILVQLKFLPELLKHTQHLMKYNTHINYPSETTSSTITLPGEGSTVNDAHLAANFCREIFFMIKEVITDE